MKVFDYLNTADKISRVLAFSRSRVLAFSRSRVTPFFNKNSAVKKSSVNFKKLNARLFSLSDSTKFNQLSGSSSLVSFSIFNNQNKPWRVK